MKHSDDNPFVPLGTSATPIRVENSLRLKLCAAFWCFGVLLLPLVFAMDAATAHSMPGEMLYVVLVTSTFITLAASASASVSAGLRFTAFVVSLALIAMQVIAIGMLSIATSGMDGVQ